MTLNFGCWREFKAATMVQDGLSYRKPCFLILDHRNSRVDPRVSRLDPRISKLKAFELREARIESRDARIECQLTFERYWICHLSGLRILKLDGSIAITSQHITTSWFEVHWKYLALIAAENSMEISFSTGGNHWFRIRVRHLRKNYGNKIESEGVQFPGRGAPDKIDRGG